MVNNTKQNVLPQCENFPESQDIKYAPLNTWNINYTHVPMNELFNHSSLLVAMANKKKNISLTNVRLL